jgi:hypothetical protein
MLYGNCDLVLRNQTMFNKFYNKLKNDLILVQLLKQYFIIILMKN